jgi:L-arabinose transport system ATP-binding protein
MSDLIPSAAATSASAGSRGVPFLRADGIVKRFANVTALNDVALEVRAGEALALAGENGSGKSTFVKILSGVVAPDAGTITLDGEPQRFATPRDALSAGIALVSQEPTAVPELSIGENVMLPFLQRSLRGFSRRATLARAVPHLEAVGLDVDPGRPFSTLRHGQRELAEVAKALACEPRLLILDEVTTRLPDPEQLFALVDRLRDRGVATIFITHRLREMGRLADRVVVLRDGALVGELARDEIDDDRLAKMMVGRELERFFQHGGSRRGAVALRVDEVVVPGTDVPISFTAHAGEVVGFAGLVGAGRSELLETIAGATPARSGTISVDGSAVRATSTRRALQAGIALVPEDRIKQGLVVDAPLRENITMGQARVLSIARKREERDVAADAVRELRIRAGSVDAPVKTLSGGNQQKAVIARAINRSPRVLLLDEPTRGVDVGAKEEIYRLVQELLERGMAVVIASSDLLEVLGLCDRILVLFEHRIVGELSREEATEERIALLSAGGGRDGD